MKLVLILCLAFFASCASQTTVQISNDSTIEDNQSRQTNNKLAEYVSVKNEPDAYLKINQENVKKLEIQNEKHKIVPDHFKYVDFKNFSYYSDSLGKKVKLENGGLQFNESQNNRGWIDFKDVYFVDLVNDEKKEAIALLSEVACGQSCDGGSASINIYSIEQQKPQILWNFNWNSRLRLRIEKFDRQRKENNCLRFWQMR